MFVVLGCW